MVSRAIEGTERVEGQFASAYSWCPLHSDSSCRRIFFCGSNFASNQGGASLQLICSFMFFVYFLRCSDGSLYIGQAEDLEKRLKQHRSGSGARYTAARLPVELAFFELFETRSEAIRREAQLKRWSRAKKEALVKGDKEKLKQLSRRKNSRNI